MRLVTAEERNKLFETFTREAAHLELRDSYATSDLEREKFAQWLRGEPDDLKWLNEWCEELRAGIAQGKSYKRACVVSEPLSDYQRWAHSITDPNVQAGEDLRWVPRRLVSPIALPGNDFWLFDDETVVFTVFDGTGQVTERQLYTEPEVIWLCRTAFDAVWSVAIPHNEYKPA